MENLEIVLLDFKKEELETLIHEELKLSTLNIKSSHFYDLNLGKDIEFSQVKNMKEVLSPTGTGNIVLEQLQLGITLKNVVIVFSFDEEYGDIVFNFPESEIFVDDKSEVKSRFKKLVNYLMNLKIKYNISKVIIGYEPAYDEDTMLIEFSNNTLNLEKVLEKILY
ncbi:hypothetical protein P4S93_17585 [Aneurinibacillus thermoaerophilus]|uniref:Uncharacterized protein n=1 Tax=Aneurinibacillus thermoaerophilus TaxID=143495 RepID=A0A1G8CYY0_ANETH|nr:MULTISPECIES: hypothetical protein [Aneurinibacillus]AMA72258.1 hypothetical protein ACH33_04920 [Aneurinibacillus sp. XH2]MED0758454.1 hypothetical protein [Aneurinibacillus thermoaerophilus]MED0762545.1 hypothetical protein [Aneurinibacillus thermoaerophilus]SDH50554.1 hypothetical protein SAMN04489735_102912 [Aneurinibacillus thermoaerophilus]